jgi:hypothetical protein
MRATHYQQNVTVQLGGTGSRYAMPEVLHGWVIFTSTPKFDLVETLKSLVIKSFMRLDGRLGRAETQDVEIGSLWLSVRPGAHLPPFRDPPLPRFHLSGDAPPRGMLD